MNIKMIFRGPSTNFIFISSVLLIAKEKGSCNAFSVTKKESRHNLHDLLRTKDLFFPSIFGLVAPRATCISSSPAPSFIPSSKRFSIAPSSLMLAQPISSTKEESQDGPSLNSDYTAPPQLLPFDPEYSTHGLIGNGSFIIQREGEPTHAELSNENLLRILNLNCTDLEVNTLVWKGLGYRFDPIVEIWDNANVFPKWKEKFPSPPDLIGMQRIYTKEIDQPSLKSNQQLVKSVPVDNKQSLKTHLIPLGFKGYQFNELTPNKTRRAQCANWILYFREELYGYTIEELKERRVLKCAKQEKEEEEKKKREGRIEDEWKPPVKEVF